MSTTRWRPIRRCKLGVLGDFNGFYFEGAVGAIEAVGLTDLHRLNAAEERYSYISTAIPRRSTTRS